MYMACLGKDTIDWETCDICFVRATRDKLREVLQRLPNNNVKRSGLITNNILNFICRTKSQATVEIKRRALIHLLPGHIYRYETLLSKVLTRNFLDSQTDCLDYVLEFVYGKRITR